MRLLFEIGLVAVVAAGGWMLAAPTESPIAEAPATTLVSLDKPASRFAAEAPEPKRAFALCHSGGGRNCVVDGDTFWMDGIKIRVADIDAPETHPPRCPEEARLGNAATLRLQALLSAGPVTLVIGGRATDRYGRALRIALRDGRSLGEQLVAEGLARRWTGRRQPWC